MDKTILFSKNKTAKVKLKDGLVEFIFPPITVEELRGLSGGKLSDTEMYDHSKIFVLGVLKETFGVSKVSMDDVNKMDSFSFGAILSKLFELNGWSSENDKKEPLKK